MYNYIFFFEKWNKYKYTILLILPFEEIGLQPELSRPARFRIQGRSLRMQQQQQQ